MNWSNGQFAKTESHIIFFSSVCQMQFLLVQLTWAFNIHNGCVLTLNYLLLSLGPYVGIPGCDNPGEIIFWLKV